MDACAGGEQPLAHLPRNRATPRRVSEWDELHARGTPATDGASVLRLVGISNYRVLCAHGTLWHTAGFHVSGRLSSSTWNWRDPRLGAVALSVRRARARILRRHAPVRTCGST